MTINELMHALAEFKNGECLISIRDSDGNIYEVDTIEATWVKGNLDKVVIS